MVEIPEMSELTFEERAHIYRLDDMVVPSVTTLMKPLSEDYYQGISTEVLTMAAARGTAVHNAIENYVRFGIEDIDPQYEGYLTAFKKWWGLRKPEVIATEQKVYHKILRYAGTADLLAVINGRLTMVDFKTSAQVNTKLCDVQLEGYDRAFESHGIKVEDRLILHLKRTEDFSEVPFKRSAKSWSVLSALLTIHNYMRT